MMMPSDRELLGLAIVIWASLAALVVFVLRLILGRPILKRQQRAHRHR